MREAPVLLCAYCTRAHSGGTAHKDWLLISKIESFPRVSPKTEHPESDDKAADVLPAKKTVRTKRVSAARTKSAEAAADGSGKAKRTRRKTAADKKTPRKTQKTGAKTTARRSRSKTKVQDAPLEVAALQVPRALDEANQAPALQGADAPVQSAVFPVENKDRNAAPLPADKPQTDGTDAAPAALPEKAAQAPAAAPVKEPPAPEPAVQETPEAREQMSAAAAAEAPTIEDAAAPVVSETRVQETPKEEQTPQAASPDKEAEPQKTAEQPETGRPDDGAEAAPAVAGAEKAPAEPLEAVSPSQRAAASKEQEAKTLESDSEPFKEKDQISDDLNQPGEPEEDEREPQSSPTKEEPQKTVEPPENNGPVGEVGQKDGQTHRPKTGARLWVAIVVLLIVIALGCTLPYWWYFKREVPFPAGVDYVDVTVPSGASGRAIASRIEQAGIDVSADALTAVMRIQEGALAIHAGRYRFVPGMTVVQIVDKLQRGDVEKFTFRISEGMTIWQLRDAVAQLADIEIRTSTMTEEALRQVLGVEEPALEGVFAPETYSFRTGITDIDVYRAAYREQKRILAQAWSEKSPEASVKTPYEALILASIIEKETSLHTDRALVSSVFNNRLRRHMPLQTDPTIIYGIGRDFNGNLTRRDMQKSGPYNTYLNQGLPPTPISMPSEASIRAALKPQKTSFLYFVARGDGTTHFSKSLAEHNLAVEKFQKAPARRARALQKRRQDNR